MTAIAVKKINGSVYIASDGRETMSNSFILRENAQKIFNAENVIFGLSGDYRQLCKFFNFAVAEEEQKSEPPTEEWYAELPLRFMQEYDIKDDLQFDALMVVKDNCRIYRLLDNVFCLASENIATIGSGDELCLGAMEAGATPTEAVKIACKHLASCGGVITTICIN